MRCLTLADELRKRGHECCFLCREQEGDLLHLIRQRDYPVLVLSEPCIEDSHEHHLAHAHWLNGSQRQDAEQCRVHLAEFCTDWLVVDHYALDIEWEQSLADCVRYCLVIDDLADRKHSADLLLDQNAGRVAGDYWPWIPAECHLMVGPEFALLRPEFRAWRPASLSYRRVPEFRRLLISFGGVDKDNFAGRTLTALSELAFAEDLQVTLVLGHSSPWRAETEQAMTRFRGAGQVVAGVGNMAEILATTDFVIGACGSSAWERCCLGVPSLVFVSAENQQIIADGLSKQKAAITADSRDIESVLKDILPGLYREPQRLLPMIQAASDVCSGLGAEIVADRMESVFCG